jgi:hypothetical protein
LECRIGKAPIIVPVEHVAQIIDYETSPLPLTRRWITGAGLHDDRLVMTVGLMTEGSSSSAPQPACRRTKGVLLNVPDSQIAWALEVQEVVVLVKATVIERRRAEPRTGDLLTGLDAAEATSRDVHLLHAGTARDADGLLVSSGGRVLDVVATGATLEAARDAAYRAVEEIQLDGGHHRSDIALAALRGEITVG